MQGGGGGGGGIQTGWNRTEHARGDNKTGLGVKQGQNKAIREDTTRQRNTTTTTQDRQGRTGKGTTGDKICDR